MTPDTGGQPGPTGMTIGGLSSDKMIPLLTMAANNPQLPAESRALAKTLLESALKGENLTQRAKGLSALFRSRARRGPPGEGFQRLGRTRTPASKSTAKERKELRDDVRRPSKARAQRAGELNTLAFMGKLVESPQFYSGTGGEYVTKFKRASGLYGRLSRGRREHAQPNELFTKALEPLVLDAANGSLGAGVSNADRDFIQAATANIANTPEGNKAIIQLAMKVAQRKQEIAKMARDYAKANGGHRLRFRRQARGMVEQTPLFPESQTIGNVSGSDMPGGVPAPGRRRAQGGPEQARGVRCVLRRRLLGARVGAVTNGRQLFRTVRTSARRRSRGSGER
jgi:hypothetical protein